MQPHPERSDGDYERSKFSHNFNKNHLLFELNLLHKSRWPKQYGQINNFATAQLRKDTPSLIDVNGFGRPKEFSGKKRISNRG